MRREPSIVYPPPPQVFTELPSVDELAAAVNRTDSIQQLSTNSASVDVLSMPRLPKLTATVNLERDRRFRMKASLPVVLGAGMDLGSNDERFWFEVPEGISKTLYYARHDRYRQQLSRAILPVDPTWLISAMGLVHLDPSTVVAGPIIRSDGLLEVRSALPMPNGDYQQVYFIEPSAGYVTHQFLYAPPGQLVATSLASNHRYYDQQQCALPHRMQFKLIPNAGPPLEMQIDVGSYAVNQLLSGDPNLFVMPQTSQQVDLTLIGAGGAGMTSAAGAAAAAGYTADRSLSLPLRGERR